MYKHKTTFIIIKKTIALVSKASPLWFFLTLVANIASGLILTFNVYIWKEIIDALSSLLAGNQDSLKNVILWFGIHYLLALIMMIFGKIEVYTQTIFGELLDKHINAKILDEIEILELSDYECEETYNIIQKASQQSFQKSISILNTFIQIIKASSSILGTIVMVIQFSWIAIIICFVSIIPMFFINNHIMNKWYDVFTKRFEKLRYIEYLKSMSLKYENIKELKIFNVVEVIKKKILNIYENNINEDKKIRKKFLIQTSGIGAVDLIFSYLIKGIIIAQCVLFKLTIGSMIAYMEAIDILKVSLNNIISMISQAYEDSLYMKNLFELFDLHKYKDKKSLEFNCNFKKIELKNVYFKYRNMDNYALENINYTFFADKTYAIVGLNGSGKTTLLKIILGMYQVERGEVLIDGININDIDKKIYYKSVSAIFQDFIKYPFNVRENISIHNDTINEEKVKYAAKFSGADIFINNLPSDYNTQLMKEWSESVELSLGQWQKIAVSRAVYKDFKIVVLDEPTASIDAVTEHKLFSNFKELSRNKLCFLVTHRLSNIKFVDEIIVLENGQIREQGNHSELIKLRGTYCELFEMQADGYDMRQNESAVV